MIQVTKVWLDGEKLMAEPIDPTTIYQESAQDDPCSGCRKGVVCRTPKCGRLKLPVDHPHRSEQPAQQEPYCYTYTENGEEYFAPPKAYVPDDATPLYTSPPAQRKPLTDEQIIACNYPDGEENGPTIAAPDFELICFARQIEAAHGIKENT